MLETSRRAKHGFCILVYTSLNAYATRLTRSTYCRRICIAIWWHFVTYLKNMAFQEYGVRRYVPALQFRDFIVAWPCDDSNEKECQNCNVIISKDYFIDNVTIVVKCSESLSERTQTVASWSDHRNAHKAVKSYKVDTTHASHMADSIIVQDRDGRDLAI